MSLYRIFYIIFVVSLLSACGGGGGSNDDSSSGGSGGSGGSTGGTGGGTGGSGGSSGSGSTGTWSTGQILSNRSLSAYSKPSTDIAPDGSAIVAWVGGQQTGSTTPIMVSHLPTTGATWSAARQIDSGIGNALLVGSYSSNPDVGMDDAGNAIVVWMQDDGTQVSAFTSRYLQTTDSWTTPVALETDDAGAPAFISVAVDTAGNAMAVWIQQTPGQVEQLWSNTYNATTQSWASSVVVDSNVNAVRPVVRTDANGDFRVFYVFQGTTNTQLQSRAFNMTSQTWQAAEVISSESQIVTIEVAQDSAGEWVAMWTAMDGANYESLFSSRRDSTLGTWSSAFSQESLPYNIESMTMVAAPNGKLTIAWSQPDRNRVGFYLDLYIRSYTPTDGWATTTRFDDLGGRIPLLISSGDDEARLFWSTLNIIRETTYTPASGWSAESRPICTMTDATYCSNNLITHDAVMNTSKRAVYAWSLRVNSKNIVAVSVLQ